MLIVAAGVVVYYSAKAAIDNAAPDCDCSKAQDALYGAYGAWVVGGLAILYGSCGGYDAPVPQFIRNRRAAAMAIPNAGQLESNAGQLESNAGQLESNAGQLESNAGQLEPAEYAQL